MVIMEWPFWLWCWACSVAKFVGIAIIVRRWLVPWTLWLGTRVRCWSRYALSVWTGGRLGHRPYATGSDWSTCTCCGGVDFDGMIGRWAVVTGCTDGIGKEYALQLADRGMNVALVSRNMDKLLEIAEKIKSRHSGTVQTRIAMADFTSVGGGPLSETYDSVRSCLHGLDVGLLINNAGVGYARPERLLDLPPCCAGGSTAADPCRDIVECNALAAVAMCRIAMPLMTDSRSSQHLRDDDRDECDGQTTATMTTDDDGQSLWLSSTPTIAGPSSRSANRGGVVVNVSSGLGQVPCPMLAVYGATKAFLDKFSVDLQTEHCDVSGIDRQRCPPIEVRCLTPGIVSTKMTRIRPTGCSDTGLTFVPNAATYARHSLRSLGCHCGCRSVRKLRYSDDGSDVNPRKDRGDESVMAWLSGAANAVFISPFSPFSTGPDGTTSGYLAHTISLRLSHMIRWLLGDKMVSDFMRRALGRQRERMIKKAMTRIGR